MTKFIKFLKSRFGNGFTFLVVPNSGEKVCSFSIPFSAAILIAGIILFNIYIFIGFTTQVGKIASFKHQISNKNHEINLLKKEQREIKPTLDESRKALADLNRLKAERERILSTWRALQQKSSRINSSVSRGAYVRNLPYTIKSSVEPENSSLGELKESIGQLTGFMKEEANAQQSILKDLLSYEQKLDHTPSIWPVSTFITSWFGGRFHPTYHVYKKHTGVDINAGYGTRVTAAADGLVKSSEYRSGYGNVVIIDHGYGYETLYAHNSKLLVRTGQQVKKGQKISLSGSSGTSTGPHLHYEVHINGNPVNPVNFLRN